MGFAQTLLSCIAFMGIICAGVSFLLGFLGMSMVYLIVAFACVCVLIRTFKEV